MKQGTITKLGQSRLNIPQGTIVEYNCPNKHSFLLEIYLNGTYTKSISIAEEYLLMNPIVNKLDEDRARFNLWCKEIEEKQAKTGCECRPQMRNAGTNDVEFFLDEQGCPLHCHHKGIRTCGQWWCECGASWDD